MTRTRKMMVIRERKIKKRSNVGTIVKCNKIAHYNIDLR